MSSRIAPEQATQRAAPDALADPVILLDAVSVRYRVPQERIESFKEYAIRRLQGRIGIAEFWGLRDVSLRVDAGEIFGIVGRNGAGKTTLLKIVARVLRPTRGRVRVRGHVAPLLELGAGFHPELTGRENIFLNAALLGHPRREIENRFGEIIDFAEIGEFIDAPIRTYSSGMIARLGFAVATAWRPDVLILDEVLAVGDEAFQGKCRLRLQSFRDEGATVLLVSHSSEMVRTMCHHAIWLDHGMVRARGSAEAVLEQYRLAAGIAP
jgi:ABC-2 type transport system ATP-binding protein/lipopolysaccharide transport system ATP-binding protein